MLTDVPLGVNQFLLTGKERALLIDTGYGRGCMLRKVKKLTSLPVTVVNTHLHPDHSGGNGAFDTVYVGEEDMPERGIPSNGLFRGVADAYRGNFPVRPLISALGKKFLLTPGDEEYLPMPEEFDLGGRKVRTVKCPGHTPGSVLFLDEGRREIFAGDAINSAQWLFTCPGVTASEYAELWERLKGELSGFEKLRISHSRKPLPIGFIDGFVRALRNVNPENSKEVKIKGTPHPLMIYTENDEVYGKIGIWAYPSQMR